MVEPLKRRLPSDVTFVTVYGIYAGHFLYVITFKYSCVLFMFVLLFIYHAK